LVFRIHHIVVKGKFLQLGLPVSLIKRPKPLSKPFHHRLNEGLVWVVDKEELEFVDIERCFYFDRIAQGTDGCLNGSVFDKMLQR